MNVAKPTTQFALFLVALVRLTATGLSPACDAVNRHALEVMAGGHVLQAETQLSQLASQVGEPGDDQLCLGVTLSNLSAALGRLGKLDLAEQSARRSASLLEGTLGPSAPILRAPLLLLAQLAIAKRRFSKASILVSRVESLPRPSHAELAVTKGLSATLSSEVGNLVEAEAEYRQSIDEWELAGQSETLEMAPELCNLATLYLNDDRVPDALALLERSLRIAEKSPLDAETYIKTLLILAVARAAHHESKAADTHFQRAMDLVSSLPPALQREIGRNTYLQYASFLQDEGRKREAKVFAKEAYARFGRDPATLTVGVNSLLAKGQ
jgi:tetratricopeptide (TPR) repeat protein